jgi:hypothetical protein
MLAPRRVLIADDNVDWARGMSFALEDEIAVRTA